MRCLEFYASVAIMTLPALAMPTTTRSRLAGFSGVKTAPPSESTPDFVTEPMIHYNPPDSPLEPNLTKAPANDSALKDERLISSRQLAPYLLPSPEEEWLDEGEYSPHMTPGIVIIDDDQEPTTVTPEFPWTTTSAPEPVQPSDNHSLASREDIESTFKGYIDHCEGCLMRSEDTMWCVCRSTKGQARTVLKRVECEAKLNKRLGNSDGNLVGHLLVIETHAGIQSSV
ncbi:hypothetical protein PspLS_07710 [Pyricularia sp. CBS 133598]|nr:hypothetical protein PspLS_07710 [Pyricularia sp. CBS 133598]